MDDAIEFAVEMNETIWKRFKEDLKDVLPEEAEWRPVPEANNINLIVRHLRIEAQWQFEAIDQGVPMPAEVHERDQKLIDSAPLDDFQGNMQEVEKWCSGFIDALRRMTLPSLEERGIAAYQEYRAHGFSPGPHMLGFHHAMHLAGHLGQIHTIRNLYRKTRGEPARFYPDNPTFPR